MRISDWSSDVCSSDLTRPEKILANLKKQSDYYNYNQRTLLSFFDEAAEKGFNAALADRMDWGDMRMAPTDVADISGYRSEEHTSELQSLMRKSYAVFCLKKKTKHTPSVHESQM